MHEIVPGRDIGEIQIETVEKRARRRVFAALSLDEACALRVLQHVADMRPGNAKPIADIRMR